MLGNPSPASRLQSLHAGRCDVPVNGCSGIMGEALVTDPIDLGDGILNGFVQAVLGRRNQLVLAAPDSPAFIVDGNLRSVLNGSGHS